MLCIQIMGKPIYRSPKVKPLEFHTDQQLSWDNCMAKVNSKCNSGLAVPGSAYGSLPRTAFLTMYRSFIDSHFRYAIHCLHYG